MEENNNPLNNPVIGHFASHNVPKKLHENNLEIIDKVGPLVRSLSKVIDERDKLKIELEHYKQKELSILPILVYHKNRGPALITEECIKMEPTGDRTSCFIELDGDIIEVTKEMVIRDPREILKIFVGLSCC
jgi:hypothetical protein